MADSPTRDAASTQGANLCLNCSPQRHRDPWAYALSPSKPPAATKAKRPSRKAGPVRGRVRQRDEAGGRAHPGIYAVPSGIPAKVSMSKSNPGAVPGPRGVLSRHTPPPHPVAPLLHAEHHGQLCSLPPTGLTTSAFKKKHSSNLTASKTGTWTLSCQCHVHGSNSRCHSVPRSQPGSLLLPEELGNPSKKGRGESGLLARAVANTSAGRYSPSRSRGHDLAQEEQEQSLAKGRAAAAPRTRGRGDPAGSSSVPKIRGSFCPREPPIRAGTRVTSRRLPRSDGAVGVSKGQGSICTQR